MFLFYIYFTNKFCQIVNVVFYRWVLTNNEEHVYIYKYNLIRLFVDGDACMEQESNQRDFAQRSHRETELPAGTDFIRNSRPYIVLKLQHDPHAMLVFHWSRLTPRHCLFFPGHGLHPRNACFR